MKVWDWGGIKLRTPGIAVGLTTNWAAGSSVHTTDIMLKGDPSLLKDYINAVTLKCQSRQQ